METIKGKTRSGFAFELPADAGDNMELLDAIVEATDNPAYFAKVITLLIGKEQKKALYEHLRGEDGRVRVQAVSDALTDIFGSLANGKNS